jgi:hypothetical protein
MALEQRNGQLYYYRSVRTGERVRKEYVGAGEFAAILARDDDLIRQERAEERDRERAELEQLEALATLLVELQEAAEVLARAHLVAGGYHRHKGEWRQRRA